MNFFAASAAIAGAVGAVVGHPPKPPERGPAVNYLLPKQADPTHRRIGVTYRHGYFFPYLHRAGQKITKRPVVVGHGFHDLHAAQGHALRLVGLPHDKAGLSESEAERFTLPEPEVVRTLASPYLVRGQGVKQTECGAFLSYVLIDSTPRILGRHASAEQAARWLYRIVGVEHPAKALPLDNPGDPAGWVYFKAGKEGLTRGSVLRDGVFEELSYLTIQSHGGRDVMLRRFNPFFWGESLSKANLDGFRRAGTKFGID